MDKYKKIENLLYNYKMLEISITNMEQEIEYLNQEDGLSGISYDSISTSPTNLCKSSTEGIALSNMEKVHWLEHNILRATRDIEKLDMALEGLEEVEKQIVKDYYINNKQWWQVASVAMYSESWCKKLRTKAIRKLVIGVYGAD